MSFSQQVKKEIAQKQWQASCCATAACYGIACFGKYFDTRGVVLHTEKAYIGQWAKAMFQAAGIAGKVYVRGEKGGYEFAVKDPYEVEKMLVMFSHSGDETALRLNRENILCSGCLSAFVGAAFLCCGVVPNPEKGYMLEFVSSRYLLMQDFELLLRDNGFAPKITTRKGANVLYFKASEQIEDLLTLMGAQKSALEIMNLKVYKDFRNKANRITNCETANIDKTVEANRTILNAIALLERRHAIDALPEPLQQAVALRRDNPALSLAELAQISEPPVTKSGLSHRYKKIKEIAEKMQNTPSLANVPANNPAENSQ